MSANSENSHSDDATPWRDVGSDEWRRKENMPEATSWRGQTLEQRRTLRDGAPGTPAIGKFAVFCDDTGDAFSAASAQILDTTEPVGCVSSALTPRRNRSQAVHTTVENLLNSFDNLDTPSTNRTRHMVKGKSKQLAGKHPERMVMPADMLFPHGGDVPQCVEEARAQLARYAFDYEAWHEDEQRKLKAIEAERVAVSATKLGREALQRSNIPLNDDDYNDDEDDEDDEDDGIADESASPSLLGKRKAAASSPTINTRAAQEGMLEIWNDMSNSDSDSESLQGLQPKTKLSKLSSVVDDDYQFTMGPVAPNIMPEGLAEKPAVIPSSTRSTRFRSFQDNADASSRIAKDENDPPTLMLRGVHPFTQPDMMTPKAKATPLAARSQSRPLSGAATVGVVRRRQPHFRTSSVDEGDAPLISKTPIAQRVSVFKDSSPLHPSLSPILDSEPSPLFVSSADAPSTPAPLGKRFAVFSDSPSAVSDVVDANNADVHQDMCGSKDKPSGVYYSTPAHGRAHFVGRSSLLTPAQRPVSNSAYPQTPGHTANASGYLSGSGAELTGVTGFTGLSSIGSSTALLLRGELDIESERVAGAGNNHTDDDEQHSEDPVAHTPVRKRLSMAVRDLGNITPRFPKSPTDANSHFMGLDDDDEDEDEDEDGEDDEDEPHTENIGEFGNLDSQMHALQAEFGGGRFAHPSTPAQQQERPFSVFRD
ncbi:hypothetical protein EC988_005157 [Linderina pennispora]|nr:hypothetical protein EC988_005157 [Linderina pennispora]